MLYLRYGNMEIKKQTQVFVTVSYDIKQFSYKICQKHKVIIRYKSDEELHNISYLEKISELSTKTFLERTYFLDGYFACSVGNVSEEMLRKYIENQG